MAMAQCRLSIISTHSWVIHRHSRPKKTITESPHGNICCRKRASANFVILQQMVSPFGLIAELPPIFRMVTLFRMVAFIPAHRSEAHALTKKYATMETALLQTFVVLHITTTFPMEQLHGRARLAHKYIHVTISRFKTHFTDLSTHTIHSHAHINRMLRHNYTVILIQIEHNRFLRTK